MKSKQIPDITGSAETITRSCCLCHFAFAAKSDGKWNWHEFAVAHSGHFEFYLCFCVSTSWHNSDKQQKDGAFPQINRDPSLNFDWMTKQNQLLKVCFYFCLTPASWQLAGSSQRFLQVCFEGSVWDWLDLFPGWVLPNENLAHCCIQGSKQSSWWGLSVHQIYKNTCFGGCSDYLDCQIIKSFLWTLVYISILYPPECECQGWICNKWHRTMSSGSEILLVVNINSWQLNPGGFLYERAENRYCRCSEFTVFCFFLQCWPQQ